MEIRLIRISLIIFSIEFCQAFKIADYPVAVSTTQNPIPVATTQSLSYSRGFSRGDSMHHDDEDEEMEDPKAVVDNEYWGGYYDFLINEGSYKFWAVFQVATAALLIYSGFAALYYAKVNPPSTDDYEDYFLRRRRRKRRDNTLFHPKQFFSIDSITFQRIMDALQLNST